MKVAWGENWVFYFGESDRLIGRTAKKIVDSRFHARRTRRRTNQLDGQIVSDRQAPDVKTGQTNFQVTWSVCASMKVIFRRQFVRPDDDEHRGDFAVTWEWN